MLLGRAAIYFDEVARRGALRRAADSLHIAPSAIDRQIMQLEESLGIKLFERTPTGMRLTAAGELLVDGVRRWRRDLQRIHSEIDNLVGLRRGKVTIAIVEGAIDLVSRSIATFREVYPGIEFAVSVHGAQGVVDRVLAGEMDVGITFNPSNNPSIRIHRAVAQQLCLAVARHHPLATREDISLAECADIPMILPDESLSSRRVLERAWARSVGGSMPFVVEVASVALMKSLVTRSVGAGWLTSLEDAEVDLIRLIPLRDTKMEPSVLAVVSAAGRSLSVPANLLLARLGQLMDEEPAPDARA